MTARTTMMVAVAALVVTLLTAPAAAVTMQATRSPAAWELNGRRGEEIVTSLDPHTAVVIPGSRSGPDPKRARAIGYYGDQAHALSAGDVNGDGYGDVIFTDPAYNRDNGVVVVLPGGPGGHRDEDRYLVQPPGVQAVPRRFGAALAVADVDADGYDDVVTTVQYARYPTVADTYQRPVVLWGGRSNLSYERQERSTELWDLELEQDALLAVGKVTGDGHAEVVVVQPGAAPTADDPHGEAGRLWWCAIAQRHDPVCSGPRPTAAGVADIAVGDVSGGRRDDVVVGQPISHDGMPSGGGVWVHRGTRDGFANPLRLSQGSPGIPGTDEAGDEFGASVVIGTVNADGKDDLVVGAPGELRGAGRVTVLYGARRGPGRAGARMLSQDTRGIADRSDSGDRFGAALSLLDVDGDGDRDLVLGAPGENGGRGAITVVPAHDGRPAPGSSWRFTRADIPRPYPYGADEREGLGRSIGR